MELDCGCGGGANIKTEKKRPPVSSDLAVLYCILLDQAVFRSLTVPR